MATEYEIHEAADILPPLREGEFEELVQSIFSHGLLEPILLFEKKIIDGRARYRACKEASVKPHYLAIITDDPTQFVLETNLPHRDLTVAQRVACAMEVRVPIAESARTRRGRGGAGMTPDREHERGATAQKLADMFGVGRNSIERGVALQKRKPSYIPRLKSGEFATLNQALTAAGIKRNGRWIPTREDRFYDVIKVAANYFEEWQEIGYKHINPREAAKRLERLIALRELMDATTVEMEERSVKAKTTV